MIFAVHTLNSKRRKENLSSETKERKQGKPRKKIRGKKKGN